MSAIGRCFAAVSQESLKSTQPAASCTPVRGDTAGAAPETPIKLVCGFGPLRRGRCQGRTGRRPRALIPSDGPVIVDCDPPVVSRVSAPQTASSPGPSSAPSR